MNLEFKYARFGRLNDFNIETHFDNIFFMEKYADYIPLMSFREPGLTSSVQYCVDSYYSYGNTGTNYTREKQTEMEKYLNRIAKKYPGIASIPWHKSGRIFARSYEEMAKITKEAIYDFLRFECNSSIICNRTYNRTSYVRIFNTFYTMDFKTYYLQSTRAISSGSGAMYHHDSEDFFFTIVMPTKLIEYQKYYYLLNGKLDINGLEFWIRRDFDVPSTQYKAFRSQYRRRLKPVIQESGIKIVEKNIVSEELVPTFKIPSDSIQAIEEWKKKLNDAVFQNEKIEFNFPAFR